ncbi:MAG: PEP-CTERM sorting domain-containing protein [Acidobacteriota bacterium]|jgi:hypothetical protein|nr:PEP-CTERM sorting domain-containing protein [Acidobacteriota bacterium]
MKVAHLAPRRPRRGNPQSQTPLAAALLLAALCALAAPAALLADEIVTELNTGTAATTGSFDPDGSYPSVNVDAQWRAAYLGDFGIGDAHASTNQANANPASHAGTHVVGENVPFDSYGRKSGDSDYTSPNFYLPSGYPLPASDAAAGYTQPGATAGVNDTELTVAMLAAAANAATYSSAFIYNTELWPVGVTNNPWQAINNSSSATWIGPVDEVTTGGGNITARSGYYAFQVDLPPVEAEDATYQWLHMTLATDNMLIAILLDGQPLNSGAGCDTNPANCWYFNGRSGYEGVAFGSAPYEFYINAGLTHDTEHTLTFIINNYAWGTGPNINDNPVGFYGVGATYTNTTPAWVPTPEPSSVALVGAGLAALVGIGRRRRKNARRRTASAPDGGGSPAA